MPEHAKNLHEEGAGTLLVYANHLRFHGVDAERAIFKAVGGWLKEQLGYGLHPSRLEKVGEFSGKGDHERSRLRVYATAEEEPRFYAWVVKHPDATVRGRQWTVEVGLKVERGALDLSCVVREDEYSTLVAAPVVAGQPRLIRYIAENVQAAKDADFAKTVPGIAVKAVGQVKSSYAALAVEIERAGREGPIVLVSPTKDGEYLVNVADLQQKLLGLAQVVRISESFNGYDMKDVLGEAWSVWGGAVKILYPRTPNGVYTTFFLSDEIAKWGDDKARVSKLLALVTNSTNSQRLYKHIRPEGIVRLSLQRRMQAVREKSQQLGTADLRRALEEQGKILGEWADESKELEDNVSKLEGDLSDLTDALRAKDYKIEALQAQLDRAGGGRIASGVDAEGVIETLCRTGTPSPLACVHLIEKLYGERCVVLDSARISAEEVGHFRYGGDLLGLLKRLVVDYRDKLIESGGGDSEARKVFGRYEYAAKESETVMKNKEMRRKRTFEYKGEQVEMFKHLKIGAGDDTAETVRVHFHWDAAAKKVVVGWCGKHRPISSR